MGRPPCCDKANVKRGLWTAEEDAKILAYVSTHGIGNWTLVPKKAGLNRCGKSCRLRWTNYLRPDLKHSEFTPQEEQLIIDLHQAIGSRWSLIAKQLPGRTDNDVKNHWNTKLKKRLIKMAIDPLTHKPLSQIFSDYENVSGSHTHPHPHAHVLQQNLPLPQPPLDLESRSFLCGLTSLDIPMFPITEQQLPHADFTHISASNLHLFDQVSPSCSSSSSPSSSVTSSLQSISSNRPSFAWSSNIRQFDPSPHTNRRQQNDYTFQEEDYSTQEQNDAPQPQGIHQGGDYKNGPVADGESGAAPSDFKDNFVTEETGMSACYQPIPAPVNSFVKAILDRDSQLQLEFPVFDDILDY